MGHQQQVGQRLQYVNQQQAGHQQQVGHRLQYVNQASLLQQVGQRLQYFNQASLLASGPCQHPETSW